MSPSAIATRIAMIQPHGVEELLLVDAAGATVVDVVELLVDVLDDVVVVGATVVVVGATVVVVTGAVVGGRRRRDDLSAPLPGSEWPPPVHCRPTSPRARQSVRRLPYSLRVAGSRRDLATDHARPWQTFVLRPLPQGQGSLRPARANTPMISSA